MVGAFGEVLVMDWGLAKVVGDGADLVPTRKTAESAVLGTAGFMAPEQAAGESASVDARSDVYSLGAMLQWMATGDGVPALGAIWRKAMAAPREGRYPDVGALAADVTRFLDGAAVSAYPETLLHRAMRVAKRHRVALGSSPPTSPAAPSSSCSPAAERNPARRTMEGTMGARGARGS